MINEAPGENETALYIKANQGLNLDPSFEKRLWDVMLNNRKMFGIFDAGLALVKPDSLIRKKIMIMLAVLEASPLHCHRFLAVPYKLTHLLFIGQKAFFSVLKSIAGFVVVKAYSLLWR